MQILTKFKMFTKRFVINSFSRRVCMYIEKIFFCMADRNEAIPYYFSDTFLTYSSKRNLKNFATKNHRPRSSL